MSDSLIKEKIHSIAEAAERACVLEVSAEKPGNVSPTHSFQDTTFEDFLAGSKAIKPAVSQAAVSGYHAGERKIPLDEIGVGALIRKAASDVRKSHTGGNTHLGIALLFIPISAAAGLCLTEKKNFASLRDCIHRVLATSTVDDAISFYDAVNLSAAGGLSDSELDVKREESKEKIREKGITFLDILRLSSEKDRLAEELYSNLPIIFEKAYPILSSITEHINQISDAIVQTYLVVLSTYPDTLIAKKVGLEEAERVSRRAAEVLNAGGVLTSEGKEAIRMLDRELRVEGNKLNPGTTADLIAATVFVSLLKDELE